MKYLLVCLLFTTFNLPIRAQDRIVLLRDTTRLNLSLTDLEKQYPPALDEIVRKDGITSTKKGAFARQGKTFFDTLSANRTRFMAFIEKNKRRLPVPGIAIQTQEFIRSDGTYDRVFCHFSGQELTDQQEVQALQLIAEWYGQHPFPLASPTGFRQESLTLLGSIPQKRTVRRGPGIISTLEAAEKTTRPDTVKMLAFNQLALLTIPPVVYRFPNLEELDLSKNSLNELPARLTADIPTLKRLSLLYNAIPTDSVFFTPNKHLVALNLQGNKLTRVPASIRLNRRLESVWLGNNELENLDTKTLGRLRRLNDLNLYNAGLKTLPKTVGRLKRVRVLDLYYNKFTQLPKQLGRLKRLEQIAIAYNDIQALPPSLSKLHRLQALYVHHNRVSQLPESFQRLKNLRVLDLGYNWFTVPPAVLTSLPGLEELDMSNNNLQELPTSLGNLKGLKKLYLRSNPLTSGNATAGPYAPVIQQLQANRTEVFF